MKKGAEAPSLLAAEFASAVAPDHLDCVGVRVPFTELPFCSPHSQHKRRIQANRGA